MTVRDESKKPAASCAHSCAISVAVGREGGEHRSCPHRTDAHVSVISGFLGYLKFVFSVDDDYTT